MIFIYHISTLESPYCYKVVRKSELPVSQLTPLYPPAHLQIYVFFRVLTHVPLFLHGLLQHLGFSTILNIATVQIRM